MATVGQVHWHEGLFLQPHHLQTMQRHFGERLGSAHRLGWAYPYGLVESTLSADSLENMLLQFDRLRVITPSGLDLQVPENTELPALDIKKAFTAGEGSFMVSLGVPLWYSERANAIDQGDDADWRVKRLYRVAEIERRDENTGENPQPVLIRRINARLLLANDDPSDLEVIPLLRITHATGDQVGLPKQDPSYIPPCLVVGGSPVLRDLVRDLSNQVEASRKELILQVTRGAFNIANIRGAQFEQVFRLMILNRFSARLPHLVQTPNLSPFEMYLELRQLLSELAALHPERDQFQVANYDHDNLALPFFELSKKIRGLIRGAVAPSFQQVPFTQEGAILAAALTEEHFTRPTDYYLGIRTQQDPRALAKLLEDQDQFKLMAKSMVERAIWGIKLVWERLPPLELPSQAGLHFFRLVRADNDRMWKQIQAEKTAAIRWPGMESTDYKITLYMIIPHEESPA